MRSLSGTRNRIVLVVAGVLALAAAAWLIAVSFALITPGTAVVGGLALPGGSMVDTVVQERRGWLLPSAAIAAVLAVLAGLALLLAQIPTAPAQSQLRFYDDGDAEAGTVLAALEPQVLERALVERVEGVPGVEEAELRIAGSAAALRVQGEVTVSEGAEVEWVVEQARGVLAADLETALGAAPRAIDLLVRLRSSASAGRGDHDRVAVGQSGRGGAPVSERT